MIKFNSPNLMSIPITSYNIFLQYHNFITLLLNFFNKKNQNNNNNIKIHLLFFYGYTTIYLVYSEEAPRASLTTI